MENITITLPVNAWNVIMNALGQRPFAEVVDLIAEIKKQGEAAIIAPTAPDTEEGHA